jgi:hypothetical protein
MAHERIDRLSLGWSLLQLWDAPSGVGVEIGDDGFTLNVEEVEQLRDWLTKWLAINNGERGA